MSRSRLLLVATLPLLALAACESAPESSPAAAQVASCGVHEPHDFAAWINRMPGPGAVPTIHVVGKVDAPTGGYTFNWEAGPLDRSAVPALRLKLLPQAPSGMATQAITTEEVQYSAPATVPRYSRVVITCGADTLTEIAGIQDAH